MIKYNPQIKCIFCNNYLNKQYFYSVCNKCPIKNLSRYVLSFYDSNLELIKDIIIAFIINDTWYDFIFNLEKNIVEIYSEDDTSEIVATFSVPIININDMLDIVNLYLKKFTKYMVLL